MADAPKTASPPSRFGRWTVEGGLPAFCYSANPATTAEAVWDRPGFGPTHRHWVGLGNRAVHIVVDNDGTTGLFDERHGLKWLTSMEPRGTGVSWISEEGRAAWTSRLGGSGEALVPRRTVGPTWFRVDAEVDGLMLERTILCPEGEQPWVLVKVVLTAPADRAVRLTHTEEWAVRPKFLNVGLAMGGSAASEARLEANARRHVRYKSRCEGGLAVAEDIRFGDPEAALAAEWVTGEFTSAQTVFGPPVAIRLEALGDTPATAHSDLDAHPTLGLTSDLDLAAGQSQVLWFRFGADDGTRCDDPAELYSRSLEALAERLPSANSVRAPEVEREIPWHAALLSGGACVDAIVGGHTLGENSSYAYTVGVNGAARDPLQYGLALVYTEPDLALSVLRNTLSWGGVDGALPWGLDGAKLPRGLGAAYQRPSDFGLWALWLAAEYAAATGDVAAFEAPLSFHPCHGVADAPLKDHLALQFDFLVEQVGFGASGHLRMRSCDWADGYMGGLDKARLAADGESVLNSAMAAWVLPVWAALADKLGDQARAGEARRLGEALRLRVAGEWNGRWFNRARCGDLVVGEDTLFLEVQPWAILSGAATPEMAATLVGSIDRHLRQGSPLGARQHWPLGPGEPFPHGESLSGGVWYSLVGLLIWALSKVDTELAWDEWRRFSLTGHTNAYPNIWEGTLSGPDAYNAPEARQPGRTWGACQTWPTNNPHAHAQPLLAYLRLLGVQPLPDGSLQASGGEGAFRSATLDLGADGTGALISIGPISVTTAAGRIDGGPGKTRW
jgi:hypothetical protein